MITLASPGCIIFVCIYFFYVVENLEVNAQYFTAGFIFAIFKNMAFEYSKSYEVATLQDW